MFAQQMFIKAYVSSTFNEKIQRQFLRGKKIHFGMTEVGTRGIATADDNLNHHRGRSRGGTRGGGGCLPSLIFKPN